MDAPPAATGSRTPAVPVQGGVLVPLAFSPHLGALAAEAARLARVLGQSIRYLHVGIVNEADHGRLRQAIESSGGDPRELIIAQGGTVASVIARTARQQGSALIVAGALERETSLTYYLGSVARRLARTAPCAVLLLPQPRLTPQAFRHPLVVIADIHDCGPLISDAIALARGESSQELHVLHTYDLPGVHVASSGDGRARDPEAAARYLHNQDEIDLANLLAEHSDGTLPMPHASRAGRAGVEAIRYAQDHDCDLVIWPAPHAGRSWWTSMITGDTGAPLRRLPCALLLHRGRPLIARTATP